MQNGPNENLAATTIQKFVRRFLVRKRVSVKSIGTGIVNVHINTNLPSTILGEKAKWLDGDKPHEIMVTRIKPENVTLELTTNQGNLDSLIKYLKQVNSKYGAVINGGFYAINGFYELPTDNPIGIHRFSCNFLTGFKKNMFKKNIDNTASYSTHTSEQVGEQFEGYEKLEIESCLHLKTQTPYAVKDDYGIMRISHDGKADITQMCSFQSDEAFQIFQEQAKYLLSSGPMLVLNDEIVFTDEKLLDKNYQFEQVQNVMGSHPGSVPPGTFYHADQPNPRSAIAVTDTDELLMVTLKGNESPDNREGMTLPDFAKLLKTLGAKTALNLDGGYSAFQGVYDSSTMFKPLFIKQCGNDRSLPCSIIARERTAVSSAASTTKNKSKRINSDQDDSNSTKKIRRHLF